MERLTRTQKYADLRDQISHDREESLYTDDLSSYQNKLDGITGQSNIPGNNYQQARPVNQNVYQAEQDSMRSLDDILNSMMDDGYNNVPPRGTIIDNTTSFNRQEMSNAANPTGSIDDILNSINNGMNNIPVQPRMAEFEENVNNQFIQNTFNEVNTYNQQTGQASLSDLSNSLVDEIRHNQTQEYMNNQMAPGYGYQEPLMSQPVQPAPSVQEVEDDFSNTVSMEIGKVLGELMNNEVPVQQAQPVNAPVQAPITPVQVSEVPQVNAHPVLAQTLEQNAPIDIKNITETLNIKQEVNFVDDTIPFDVEKVQQETEEDEEEYEDDEAPSKVLNVILGVLIFVLVAVLGVIVYYILVAKGIIG